MRKIIEFATREEINKVRGSSSGAGHQQGSYTDSILSPKLASRKMRFPIGKTWLRIVPAIKTSTYDWMIEVSTLNYTDGRHAHPRTLGAGKSVFDEAYTWLKANNPGALYSKNNRDGVRLLTDPITLFWCLVEEDSKWVSRLFVGSGYDGSRGGVPGLGSQIQRLLKDLSEETEPLANPLDPVEGVMLCVDKTQPSGAKFASYSIRLGSVPTPFSKLVSQMTDDEVSALCPLEDAVRILSNEEEWARLQNTGLSSDTIATIRSSLNTGKH